MSAPPVAEGREAFAVDAGQSSRAGLGRAICRHLGREKANQLQAAGSTLPGRSTRAWVQRLFGVSMALDGGGELPGERPQRVQRARPGEARGPAQRAGAAARPRRGPTETTFAEEVARLSRLYEDMTSRRGRAEVPPNLEPLAQSVLAEVVRNADQARPSQPRSVRLGLRATERSSSRSPTTGSEGADASATAGVGLRGWPRSRRLHSGGVVEFGERRPGSWQVRLVVPHDG